MLAPLLVPALLVPALLVPALLPPALLVTAPPTAPATVTARTSAISRASGTSLKTSPVTSPETWPAPARPPGSWLPPVGGLPVTVVHPFTAPAGPYAAGHRGADLAADAGSVVHAPTAGRVVFAGQVAGRPLVVLLHAGGVRTTYEPVAPSVSVGDDVGAGQPIGTLVAAASHCLPSPCLHWGARVGAGDAERYLDPLALLAGHGPVRLLPLDGHRR